VIGITISNRDSAVERYSPLSGTFGEVLPNHTNQLLYRIEELLIENSALDSALKVVNRYLPPDAQEKVRSDIEDFTSDSTLRELVRRRFADYKNQSPDNPTSPLLNEDLRRPVRRI
jgi:hypothetical protein